MLCVGVEKMTEWRAIGETTSELLQEEMAERLVRRYLVASPKAISRNTAINRMPWRRREEPRQRRVNPLAHFQKDLGYALCREPSINLYQRSNGPTVHP